MVQDRKLEASDGGDIPWGFLTPILASDWIWQAASTNHSLEHMLSNQSNTGLFTRGCHGNPPEYVQLKSCNTVTSGQFYTIYNHGHIL